MMPPLFTICARSLHMSLRFVNGGLQVGILPGALSISCLISSPLLFLPIFPGLHYLWVSFEQASSLPAQPRAEQRTLAC